jgi:hypothetical protein
MMARFINAADEVLMLMPPHANRLMGLQAPTSTTPGNGGATLTASNA